MSGVHHDLTHPSELKHAALSGAQRKHRPVYVDLLPPCNQACPAGENIQAWLADAERGRIEAAWQVLVRDNPLPAVHGRVCYRPCETSCNRAELDSPVSIHAVERFIGDRAIEQGWPVRFEARPTGKRILVVGAGPSGLSCAYHLTRLGHGVEVFEAGPMAGGMMHFGIPKYRLPRDILEREIARIEGMGVSIRLNHLVRDLLAEKEEGSFDAAFVAVGAHLSKRVDIPARDAGQILDAVTFLRDVESGEAPKLGRRVAVYGGGNTAMDAARTAKRLGLEPLIIYRRDREHMPAHEFEADEAIEEGVKIHWLRSIKAIEESTFTVEIMTVNEEGRPVPTGATERLEADALILALGQSSDVEFLRTARGVEFDQEGTVRVNERMMTGCEGVFAGGDMVPCERTVTVAVGHGKKAARHIDAWLRDGEYAKAPRPALAGFDRLRVWYFTDAARRNETSLGGEARTQGFDEVVGGLDERAAAFEARRCLSCGNCFECDGCYGACPESAVVKLGPGKRYRFDLARCTGCAVCFEQCPCGAIEMVSEPA